MGNGKSLIHVLFSVASICALFFVGPVSAAAPVANDDSVTTTNEGTCDDALAKRALRRACGPTPPSPIASARAAIARKPAASPLGLIIETRAPSSVVRWEASSLRLPAHSQR